MHEQNYFSYSNNNKCEYKEVKKDNNIDPLVNILQPNDDGGAFSITMTIDSKSKYTHTLNHEKTLNNERFKSMFKAEELNKLFNYKVEDQIDEEVNILSPNDLNQPFVFSKENKQKSNFLA